MGCCAASAPWGRCSPALRCWRSSPDTWRWVVDVNLMGVVHGIAAFLPAMRAQGQGGHIVNTASMAGLQANIGFSPYAATKYAVVGMSEGLAKEVAARG